MFTRIRTAVVACAAGAVLTAALAVVATATPAMAYGKANWQTTFAATATSPSTGDATGFWGWCDFAGGVTSGDNGDCQIATYFHTHTGSGGYTCHENFNLTAWTGAPGTFLITGTVTVTPTSLTAACVAPFPGSTSFADVNTGIPSAAGHYDLGVGAIPGAPPGSVGEFNITVTQVQ